MPDKPTIPDVPKGDVLVRRRAGYGAAYLPQWGVTILEGEYYTLPEAEAEGRLDWELCAKNGEPLKRQPAQELPANAEAAPSPEPEPEAAD